jgi:hypothetical protein
VSSNSIYHCLEGVEAYDMKRDARTFQGGMPVVAHPPCRSWSAYCAHQAKPLEGERELALWCVGQVQTWGGILEQPAHSRLWDAAGLPKPGQTHRRDYFSMEVWQAWWGYPMKKATWLFFCGVNFDDLQIPYRLHDQGADRRRQQLMSKTQRAATCEPLARWLVHYARTANVTQEKVA